MHHMTIHIIWTIPFFSPRLRDQYKFMAKWSKSVTVHLVMLATCKVVKLLLPLGHFEWHQVILGTDTHHFILLCSLYFSLSL